MMPKMLKMAKKPVSVLAAAAIAGALAVTPAPPAAYAEPFIGGGAQVPDDGQAAPQPVVVSVENGAPVFTLALQRPWSGDALPTVAGEYDQDVRSGDDVLTWKFEVTDAWAGADGAAAKTLQAGQTYTYTARLRVEELSVNGDGQGAADLRLLNARAETSEAFWDADPQVAYAPEAQFKALEATFGDAPTAAGDADADGDGDADGKGATGPASGGGDADADADGDGDADSDGDADASARTCLVFTARYTAPSVVGAVTLDLSGLQPQLKAEPPVSLNAPEGSAYYVARQYWLDAAGTEVSLQANPFKANKTYLYTAQVEPLGSAVFREGATAVTLTGTQWADAGSVVCSVGSGKIAVELAYTFPKKVPADFTKLSSALQKSTDLSEAKYSPASWKKYRKALESGYKVLADTGASQAKVDKAVKAIADAKKALVKRPGNVTLKSVKAGKKRVTVKWKAVAGAKYQVCYKAKGAKEWSKKTVAAGKKSVVVKGLKAGKKYQVKVRAFKKVAGKAVYSAAWSKVKTTAKVK